jgi:hypothetical protein
MKKIFIALAFIATSAGAQTTPATGPKAVYGRTDIVPHAIHRVRNPLMEPTTDTVVAILSKADDNLADSVTFEVILVGRRNNPLSRGFIGMGGADYEAWDGDNRTAFEFIAGKLTLKIK